jgi:hypothetical protein
MSRFVSVKLSDEEYETFVTARKLANSLGLLPRNTDASFLRLCIASTYYSLKQKVGGIKNESGKSG